MVGRSVSASQESGTSERSINGLTPSSSRCGSSSRSVSTEGRPDAPVDEGYSHVAQLVVINYCYDARVRAGRPPREAARPVEIGVAIAASRRSAGLTRSTLAARAGISANTLMKVEQGHTRDPGVMKVAALCRVLEVSIDDLVASAEQIDRRQGKPMTNGIVSVGYEGRTIDALVRDLQLAGVRTVADVRLNAISRKAGFSKTRLAAALAEAGIKYRHLRELGNAKDNRQPFWDGRVEEGRRVFRESLETPAARASLDELGALVTDEVVAVLCFESDSGRCHRQVVIDEVRRARGVPVVALGR